MKRYSKKPAKREQKPTNDAPDESLDVSGLELEDPLPKDVEGFDPYNTGIFRIDKTPWNKDTP